MMSFPSIQIPFEDALELSRFKEMDYHAVEHYHLPIELMMENAGLQLANLIVASLEEKNQEILIGVGNGNNGGGGLVAARRLAAWGYSVYLDVPAEITKSLPKKQLERALQFGVKKESIPNPILWVDAYLGFSQRLPLQEEILVRVNQANQTDCYRISLDIPTGYLGDPSTNYFQANQVLSLAAAKKMLYALPESISVFIADLGIPKAVYHQFDVDLPPFDISNIIQLTR